MAGRLFVRDAQLYRGIRPRWADFYRRLLHSGVIHDLVSQGLLVDTEEAPDTALGGFSLVVRHRLIPAPAYPPEWCDAMFKEAALLTVRLLAALARHDLTLRDANPWNVVFDYTRPLHVDLPSIVPRKGSTWPPRDEFERFVLRPLQLMGRGRGRLARALLMSYEGVGPDEVGGGVGSLASLRWRWMMRVLGRVRARALREPPQTLYDRDLRRLRRDIERIRLPYATNGAALATSDGPADHATALERLLGERRPATVLVTGPGSPAQALVAGKLGAGVVVFDPRPAIVTDLFFRARMAGLRILPLLLDFADPPPGRGLGNHWSISGTQRFRSEAVVATGVVAELVRRRHLRFDHVAEGVAQFSTRWALVDFAVPGGHDVGPPPPSGYTLDRLAEALGRHFRHVASMPAATGSLLLCEK